MSTQILNRPNSTLTPNMDGKKNYLILANTYFLVFFISCVTGWVYEEIFYLLTENILEKRGFLYGPYLPVYGFGALFMMLLLERFRKKPVILFVLSMVVTGVLEYFTGLFMWLIWHKRWWDYTGLFLNIDGYVCLRSVVTFAIGGLLLIYFILPLVRKDAARFKLKTITVINCSLLIIMIFDLVLSLLFKNKIV